MRILHVDPERGWGGGEVQVRTLLRELVARGHDVTLAAHPGGPLALEVAGSGVQIVPLAIRNNADALAGLKLRRLVRGHDVVHFHTARAHALAPLCRNLGARLVVTRRMDYVPKGGPYVRWLYNRVVDVVIAISDGVRDALVRAGVDAARIRVVPSGVDVDAMTAAPAARAALRREWNVDEDDVLIAVLGVLEKRKGHDVLLSAALLPALGNRRVRYVFVGEGKTRDVLTEAVGRLGLPVVFAGFRTDVAACLAAADVVAMPSRQEGLGVAALEAMAAARPVVASRVGGLREAVDPGVTGLLVPPDDPAALATALGTLASDPARRERFGAAGRARILARYTGARMADGTLACYGEPPCGG